MITGYMMSAFWCAVFYYAGGAFGLILFLGQAAFAKFILEIVNYMEHYGLVRVPGTPVEIHHSWNSTKKLSSLLLYNLTRHSHHHEKGSLEFWGLRPFRGTPEMPYGYLTTLLICLIPPVWYYVITPGLDKWEKQYVPV